MPTLRPTATTLACAVCASLALLSQAPAARADHGGLSYKGHYANAFAIGRAQDGVSVAVMGGFHTDFPYHDPGSRYDQVAILVGGKDPIVVTQRPGLPGFRLEPGPRTTRLSYHGSRARFELNFKSVEHPPLYEGDPADIGDLILRSGVVKSERRPGFVYTPYELTGLIRGTLVLPSTGRAGTARTIRLRSMHGQAEAGTIDAPTDRRFRSAYDYLAAPTLSGGPYTYVGFVTRALHGGADGVLGPYFRATGSDEFTLERGRFAEGNVHGVPAPFDNTSGLPTGARTLARWRTDLGPGILHRALVLLRDRARRPLIALSETIKEDRQG